MHELYFFHFRLVSKQFRVSLTSNKSSTKMPQVLHGAPLQNPIKDLTLGEFFFEQCQKYANKTAQIDGFLNKSETYLSLNQRSVRLALQLARIGVNSEDVVVSCSGNNLDCTVGVLATCYLGATIANLDTTLSLRQTTHLINLVQPKVVLVEDIAVELIETSLRNANLTAEIIVYGNSSEYLQFSDLIQENEDEAAFRPVKVDTNRTGVIFFSSGTTGLPKGICHSHRSFLRIIPGFDESGFKVQSVLYFTTFYWISGMMMLCSTALNGKFRVISRIVESELIFRVIQEHKIDTLFLSPALTHKVTNYQNEKKYDTSSLKYLLTGGTPISRSQIQRIKATFPTAIIVIAYGLSECGIASTFNPVKHKDLIEKKQTSCGTPAVGCSIKVVDVDTRQLLGPNQKGEICIKTDTMMIGYYKTDNSNVFDSDGFLKTGDIGYYDEEHCFYVIERIKEMFKYLSWHIVPSHLEAVLLEHPSIVEAVVFGTPLEEEELGDVPTACVVLKPNSKVTEKEIEEFVAEKVSDRERLRGGVFICKELLKTASGKIMRHEIRNNFIKNLKNVQ